MKYKENDMKQFFPRTMLVNGMRLLMMVALILSQFGQLASPAAALKNTTFDSSRSATLSGTVTLWHDFEGANATALDMVITAAETANPGLTIVSTFHNFGTIYSDYETAVAAGGGPDLFLAPTDFMGKHARQELILNLDTYLTGKMTDFLQSALDSATVDGVQYAIPVSALTVALYYNKLTIDTPPTTTDELLTLLQGGKKLAAPGSAGGSYYFYGFWGAFAGELMDNSGLCIADQTAAFANAMQYLLDIQSAGATLRTDYFTAENSFLNGGVDMMINGPWALNTYKASLGNNLGVIMLPTGPDNKNARPLNGPNSFYINPHTSNPTNIVDIALTLTNQTSSQILTNAGSLIPVRSDVTSTDPLVTAFQQAAENGIARPQNKQIDNYWDRFQEMIDNVLAGTVSTSDGVQTACSKMNNASIHIDVWFKDGHASAYDWPIGSHLTMNIDDPSTASTNPDFSLEADVVVAPWDANATVAEFSLNGDYTITPGMTVTISGASRTKDLLITDLAFTDLNFAQDTVSGMAEPEQPLWMWMESSCCRNFKANAGGDWSVDFKLPGSGDEPSVDIKAGTFGTLNGPDADGDNTALNWSAKNPRISARLQDNVIEAFSWTLDSTVNLTLYDPISELTYTDSQIAEVTSWDANETITRFAIPAAFKLRAGQLVTVSNGNDVDPDKTMTIGDIAITGINTATDVVEGTASSGSPIFVGDICENNICASRDVRANDSSAWTADFQNPGPAGGNPNEQNTADLRWGIFVEARQYEPDGDETQTSWSINPEPYVKVYTDNNRVQAEYYPETNTPLTLDVTRDGISVFTKVERTELAYWNNTTIVAFFNSDGAFEFQPDDIVTLTGGGITKSLVIKSLSISNVDQVTDQISGTAVKDDLIKLVDWEKFPLTRQVTTNDGGNWTVDLSTPGIGLHEKFTTHLRDSNSGGEAWQQDADGDQVAFRWMGKSAAIQARINDNYVRAGGWQLGTQVDMSIHDPSGTYSDFPADSQTMVQASWNPHETTADFALTDIRLLPGMVVTLSGSGNTRTHTIIASPLHVTDPENDTISGVTNANGYVSVNDWGASARRGTTADDSGNWTVNFASATTDGEGSSDIKLGSQGDTWLYDDDNNASVYNWRVVDTHMDVWYQNDSIDAYDWPIGAHVTLTIQDADPATDDYNQEIDITDYAPWDATKTLGEFNLEGLFDIQPGMHVIISDGTITKSLDISNLTVTSINPVTDTITGGTEPDQSMFMWMDGSCCRAITANNGGIWTANFAKPGPNDEPTVDILTDTSGNINATDSDGDNTSFHWSTPPMVLSITRADASPSLLSSVRYTVIFSEPVTGVDKTDFSLLTTGLSGTSVTIVSGTPTTYTVTASTGTGNGTLNLKLTDNDTIQDSEGNPLGLQGIGNGNFTNSASYLIRPPGAFSKTAPANGSISQTTSISLTWGASANANSYDFCYDTTNDNNCSTWIPNAGTSKVLTGLSPNATYYWQVRAKNNTGIISYANGSLGNFWSFKKDNLGPKVTSITRLDPNPSTATSLRYTVNFSESVTGVDLGDFKLTLSNLLNAGVTAVSGSGSTRTVTVSTGTGTGTLRLDLIDNDSILDLAGVRLGGTGAGNGNFLTGDKYTLDRINQFTSIAAQDGWVLESSETSSIGGILGTPSMLVGDAIQDKQYRSILSFDTLGLPDNASIVAVTLKFKVSGTTGTSPFSSLGPLLADIQKGYFGTSTALQSSDFQTPLAQPAGAFSAVSGAAGWYQLTLAPANFAYINKAGSTQFRLRFTKDDNDNNIANYISIYGGEAITNLKPILKVDYTLP